MATSNKAFPIILIGVAALGVLAYVGMVNQPGDEVTGTVAPAQRYQAEQNNEIFDKRYAISKKNQSG